MLLNNYQQQRNLDQYIAGGYSEGMVQLEFPDFTLEETIQIINDEPDLVRSLLEDPSILIDDQYVGSNENPDLINDMLSEFRFQPSQITLQQRDYRQIKKYLNGKRTLNQLTEDQITLIKSLKYTSIDEFDVDSGNFKFQRDGYRFSNLREQLLGKLKVDNLLSDNAAVAIADVDGPMPEIFSDDYVHPKVKDAEKAPVVDEMEMANLGEVPEGRLWMMQDPLILEHYANDTFNSSYNPDLYNDKVFRTSISRNEHMYLKSQGYSGTWNEYQKEFNVVDEQFEDLWKIWDKRITEVQLWEPDEYLERTKADPFLEEPPVDSLAFKPPGPGEVELTELKPPNFIEKPTPIKPFVDDEIIEVLNHIGTDDIPGLENMLSLDRTTGDIFVDSTEYSNWLKIANVDMPNLMLGGFMMPGLITIQNLIDQIIPGSSRWINIGLGTLDLLASQNPLGLAVQGIGELIEEMNVQSVRLKEDDFAQSKRGSRYGFFKNDDGEWKPAILNSDIMSTSFGSREQVLTIQFGDTILWKKDHEGGIYPVVTNSQEYLVRADDWQVEDDSDVPFYSKSYMEKYSPTRRWVFMTPEEELDAFSGANYDEIIDNITSFTPDTDASDYPDYTKNIMDWQKTIELKEKIKYGGDSSITEWDPSTGLSRVTTYYPELLNNDLWQENVKSMNLPEEDWLLDEYLPLQIQSLVASQRAASKEAGYQDTYGVDQTWSNYYSKGLTPPGTKRNDKGMPVDTQFSAIDGQTSWSANYLLFNRDIPAATTYAELSEQITNIATYDETQTAKDYLTQKAMTRYWCNQLLDRGRGTDLYQSVMGSDSLIGADNAEYGTFAVPYANKDDQDSMMLGRDDEVIVTGIMTPYQQKPYDSWVATRGDNKLDEKTWDVHFDTGDEPVEEDVEEDVVEAEETDPILPYIIVDGVRYMNPEYVGVDDTVIRDDWQYGDQKVGLPQYIVNDYSYIPDYQEYLQGLKDDEPIGRSDWEQATILAATFEKWGESGNPDDYYPGEGYNDGTRPENYVYKPPETVNDTDNLVDISGEQDATPPSPTQPTPPKVDWEYNRDDAVEPEIHELLPVNPLTAFEEYISEQHISKFEEGVTASDLPFIPTTQTGESALYGDEPLHEQMGLPDYVKVAQDPTTGIIHEAFDPSMVTPAFSNYSNAGHAIEAK